MSSFFAPPHTEPFPEMSGFGFDELLVERKSIGARIEKTVRLIRAAGFPEADFEVLR